MIGTNILVAYPYATEKIVERLADFRSRGANVYIDSGAFSAYNAGKTIRLSEYMAFIDRLPFKPTGYFQLDVVGDREATLRNLQTQYDAGQRPIAVFQRGMPPSDLETLYRYADVVGVGGLGRSTKKAEYCNYVGRYAAGRGLHLLGHVSPPTIAAVKPTSCDSTNWMFGSRGLAVMVYGGHGKRYGFHRGQWRNGQTDKDTWSALRSYGVTQDDLRTEAFWKRGINVVGARSIIRLSSEAEAMFGSHVYLACGTIVDMDVVQDAWIAEGERVRT